MDYVARTPKQLGPILRSIRVERGLTQKEAGAKVGLKQSTVSAIESDSSARAWIPSTNCYRHWNWSWSSETSRAIAGPPVTASRSGSGWHGRRKAEGSRCG